LLTEVSSSPKARGQFETDHPAQGIAAHTFGKRYRAERFAPNQYPVAYAFPLSDIGAHFLSLHRRPTDGVQDAQQRRL